MKRFFLIILFFAFSAQSEDSMELLEDYWAKEKNNTSVGQLYIAIRCDSLYQQMLTLPPLQENLSDDLKVLFELNGYDYYFAAMKSFYETFPHIGKYEGYGSDPKKEFTDYFSNMLDGMLSKYNEKMTKNFLNSGDFINEFIVRDIYFCNDQIYDARESNWLEK